MKTHFKNKLEGYTSNQMHDNVYSAKRERGIEWEQRTKNIRYFFKEVLKHRENILTAVNFEL